MAAGPIFAREAMTAPRRLRHYLMRSGFVAGLLILFYSIRQATIGFQDVQFAGDVANFSSLVFQVFSLLQLTLGMFFATLFTASNIALEKDRQTLILLLMTDMKNRELALGKLLASLLIVAVLQLASLPVFFLMKLLGGITWGQVIWGSAIVAAASLAAGTWGGLVAFWREKTFQTLAVSVLGVILFVAVVDGIVAVAGAESAVGRLVSLASPYRSLLSVLNPLQNISSGTADVSALPAVLTLVLLSGILTVITVVRMRIWNPSQTLRQSALLVETSEDAEADAPAALNSKLAPQTANSRTQHRTVWNNPVIWREMCTRAYGRRMVWIKLVYVALALMISAAALRGSGAGESLVLGMASPPSFGFLGVCIVSLLLMNAQAVTSITTERDGRTLEPLLITDLSAKEFMLGKIGGAFWNAREMILIPLLLLAVMKISGGVPTLTMENSLYLVVTLLVLSMFSITLGLHAGLTYDNSRSAIGNSLGTMFFLFVGIFVLMLLLVEARGSFAIQLQSFIIFIGFGSLALFGSLTHKNPSNALTLASMCLPFLTFYAIIYFLLGGNLIVCVSICLAYGFAVVAMLIPAMTDFDVALGRNTQDG